MINRASTKISAFVPNIQPKSNGLIKGITTCKTVDEIMAWINQHSDEEINKDIEFHTNKYDLTQPQYTGIVHIINNLKKIMETNVENTGSESS